MEEGEIICVFMRGCKSVNTDFLQQKTKQQQKQPKLKNQELAVWACYLETGGKILQEIAEN